VRLKKVHYVLPRRTCCGCGKTTTAQVPFGQAGAVAYGVNVNAAAILLSSAGNVPVERTAMLMAALLGSAVSSGFVARAHERFAEKLDVAGFDGAMRDALAAEEVLHADETPVNVARNDTDEHGQPAEGVPACGDPAYPASPAVLVPGAARAHQESPARPRTAEHRQASRRVHRLPRA
jgi:transposase